MASEFSLSTSVKPMFPYLSASTKLLAYITRVGSYEYKSFMEIQAVQINIEWVVVIYGTFVNDIIFIASKLYP